MNGYATAGWENFFVAEVGAAAALTGLLFVAVSINLARVLAYPQLPGRAAETLVMLLAALAAATVGLVPGQSRVALGSELLLIGLIAWVVPVVMQVRTPRTGSPRHWMTTRVLTHQLATVPLVLAGATLLARCGGGLYWLVVSILLAFAAGGINAWVLLVEIQR